MTPSQTKRTIIALTELYQQEIDVESITSKLVPNSEDPELVDPVVVIKYNLDGDQREHEINIYWDGSMSDF